MPINQRTKPEATMSIFSKETIKRLAVEATKQHTSAEQCNPFINNPDAADLFKKYFETEITYKQLEAALLEKQV
jgi:hypothetical protein